MIPSTMLSSSIRRLRRSISLDPFDWVISTRNPYSSVTFWISAMMRGKNDPVKPGTTIPMVLVRRLNRLNALGLGL